MKRVLRILTVIAITALVTYLAVTRHQAEERTGQLERDLLEAEARLAQLDAEIEGMKQRLAELTRAQELSRRRTSRFSNSPRTTAAVPPTQSGTEAIGVYTSAETTERSSVATISGEVVPGFWYTTAGGGLTNLVRIEGTSSIHNWAIEGHLIVGGGQFGSGLVTQPGTETHERSIDASVTVSIPVRSLTSVEPDGKPYSAVMDKIIYNKLLADKYSRISYTLISLVAKGGFSEETTPLLYESTGKLSVAGETNTITMPVSISSNPDGRIRVAGSVPIKMSDFKISPSSPSSTGMLIKTGDEVAISFVWWLKPGGKR